MSVEDRRAAEAAVAQAWNTNGPSHLAPDYPARRLAHHQAIETAYRDLLEHMDPALSEAWACVLVDAIRFRQGEASAARTVLGQQEAAAEDAGYWDKEPMSPESAAWMAREGGAQ